MRQTDRQTGKKTGRKAGRQEGRKAGRQEDRKAGKQLGTHYAIFCNAECHYALSH